MPPNSIETLSVGQSQTPSETQTIPECSVDTTSVVSIHMSPDLELLASIESLSSLLNADRPLGSTLALICERAKVLLSCESTALCLLSDDRYVLDFVAVSGARSIEMTGQRVRVDDALPGSVALSGEPMLAFNDDLKSEKPGLLVGALGQRGVTSAAIVPIFIGEKSIGSIAAIDRVGYASFSASDIIVLQILSSVASAAIQRDQNTRITLQRERERNTLFRVAQQSSNLFDTQATLSSTLEALASSIEMHAGMVFLYNDEHSLLYIAASYALTEDQRELQVSGESDLVSSFESDGGSAFIINESDGYVDFEALFLNSDLCPKSAMVVPLVTRDGVVGAFVIGSRKSASYGPDDLALLAAVSAQTAVKLDNALLYEDATRRASEATAIYELSQSLNSALSVGNAAQLSVDCIAPLLRVDKCALFLFNSRRKCLEIVAARNLSSNAIEKMCPNAEHRGIAWWVYEFETPTSVVDVAADHRNRSNPLEPEGISSLLSVPLQAGDKVIGVVHAMSSRRRSFTVGEMELLYTVGNQVGSAIEKVSILDATRRQGSALRRSFRRVAKALSASSTPHQTERVIVEMAAELLNADRALLSVPSAASTSDNLHLKPICAHGFRLPEQPIVEDSSLVHDFDKPITAELVAKRRRVIMIEENAITDHRFHPFESVSNKVSKANFYLAIPLIVGDEVVGVIELYDREPRSVSRADMRNLLSFAAQAAIALKTTNSILSPQRLP